MMPQKLHQEARKHPYLLSKSQAPCPSQPFTGIPWVIPAGSYCCSYYQYLILAEMLPLLWGCLGGIPWSCWGLTSVSLQAELQTPDPTRENSCTCGCSPRGSIATSPLQQHPAMSMSPLSPVRSSEDGKHKNTSCHLLLTPRPQRLDQSLLVPVPDIPPAAL